MTPIESHSELPLIPALRWNPRSICLIVLAWLVLHVGCLFTPGLLDDVDSVYLEVAREMLLRHDYVTPYVDGIRFFDKPPLMYWLAAGSFHLFGVHDWAGRLPLALLTLALLLATYALGLRLFAAVSPAAHSDRAAFYSALALATSIGPFLYTRFFIPDILIALWLTLAIHAFLIARERVLSSDQLGAPRLASGARVSTAAKSALLPCLAFAAVTALNLLTKGFIGLVFPLGFVFFYLLITRQLRLIPRFHLVPSALVFTAIAAPWHILAALRNPAIALPAGLGLPAHAGWAWFYLYNEHIARFLSRRIPHDYGQVPIPLFWLLGAIWIFPWVAFLPGAIRQHLLDLRSRQHFLLGSNSSTTTEMFESERQSAVAKIRRNQQAALTLLLWTGLVFGFFTLSARQEYYSLPALPALALMAGGLLARAEQYRTGRSHLTVPAGLPFHIPNPAANHSALGWHLWLLVPIGSLSALVALFFAITAPGTDPHTDIATLLAQSAAYNLSLGHLFDLTGRAMGLFRGPLTVAGLSMLVIGPGSYVLRRIGSTYAANLTLAAAAACLLLSMHEGLVRFYPTLGSKGLAAAILTAQQHEASTHQPAGSTQQSATGKRASDLIVVDGELTAGSTLLFYTHQPLHLVNGRINGPWYGSFWPDAPDLFETDASLRRLWQGRARVFLLTYHPDVRAPDLARFGPVDTLASAGGKTILTNQP